MKKEYHSAENRTFDYIMSQHKRQTNDIKIGQPIQFFNYEYRLEKAIVTRKINFNTLEIQTNESKYAINIGAIYNELVLLKRY